MPSGKRFLLPVVSVIAAAVCIRLGFWQLARLEERRSFNREVEARLALPEVDFGELDPEDSAYRRVRVAGRFDFAHEIVLVARSLRGSPGVYVVTPLLVDSTRAVLVERGWVPSPDARSVELEAFVEAGSAKIEGVVLPARYPGRRPTASRYGEWPIRMRFLDPPLLDSLLPYAVSDMVVRRVKTPEGLAAGMSLVPLPELGEGPHLSYAVQWFAFAAIALVGGGIVTVRRPARTVDGPDVMEV